GDYITEGIPGCGVKLACEAARAGFGASLCRIKASGAKKGADEFTAWRENLSQELRLNESKVFRAKHKALCIPEEFPNVEVLRYYTHPVVSPAAVINKLKQELEWNCGVNIPDLRKFCDENFAWSYRIGAMKFVRVLSPGMLTQKLLRRR